MDPDVDRGAMVRPDHWAFLGSSLQPEGRAEKHPGKAAEAPSHPLPERARSGALAANSVRPQGEAMVETVHFDYRTLSPAGP